MAAQENPVFERIRSDLADNPVVLYMKGSPIFPQCGFSAAVLQTLEQLGVDYKAIDVLTDPSIRQGVKDFAHWPTIPQLYIAGEFVGGCDIVREMAETGELQDFLIARGIAVNSSASA
ncbi:Grx4 family monothiol glutaredoxin [Fodinicurvata sp. EGI_FJ10296]|uniref:Grx4 family monothiol glutaredoxin n=1 Tax=Fodinicurvata sp. EGI_FJ10296 TaxID=3231908 RepID=UPI00345589CC